MGIETERPIRDARSVHTNGRLLRQSLPRWPIIEIWNSLTLGETESIVSRGLIKLTLSYGKRLNLNQPLTIHTHFSDLEFQRASTSPTPRWPVGVPFRTPHVSGLLAKWYNTRNQDRWSQSLPS